MIKVENNRCFVSGGGMDVMAEIGIIINSTANSMIRRGQNASEVRAFFHHLVDVALAAPDVGTTLDLSFQKEGGK